MSLLDNLLMFGRILRQAGIDTHAARTTDLVQALAHVKLNSRDEVYHTCRALLVHRRDQIAIFDVAFDAFWRAHLADAIRNRRQAANARDAAVSIVDVRDVLASDTTDSDALDEDSTAPESVQTWSDRGRVASRDFAEFTADELADARAALSRLSWNPGERRTRRWVRGRGTRVDL